MLSVELFDATLVVDTAIYAANDLLSDAVKIANAVPYPGGRAILRSVVVVDEDEEGVALDLWFADQNTDFGTINSAPAITDAGARTVLGKVPIAVADYVDLGGAKVAYKGDQNMVLKAVEGSTDVYVAAVNGAGTPTFTAASDLKLRLGIQWEGS